MSCYRRRSSCGSSCNPNSGHDVLWSSICDIRAQIAALDTADTDVSVASGAFDSNTGILTLTKSDSSTVDINIAAVADTKVNSVAYDPATGLLTIGLNDASSVTTSITVADTYGIVGAAGSQAALLAMFDEVIDSLYEPVSASQVLANGATSATITIPAGATGEPSIGVKRLVPGAGEIGINDYSVAGTTLTVTLAGIEDTASGHEVFATWQVKKV